jgi:hypothetical protein
LEEWTNRALLASDPESIERVYVEVARGRLKIGEFIAPTTSEGQVLIQRGLDLARRLNDPDIQFLAAWHFIFSHLTTKHWRLACDVADEFSAKSRDGVSPRNQAMFNVFSGATRLLRSDRRGEDESIAELALLAERSQDAGLIVSTTGHRVIQLMLDGNLEEALDLASQSLSEWHESRVNAISLALPGVQVAAYMGRQLEPKHALEPYGYVIELGHATIDLQARVPLQASDQTADFQLESIYLQFMGAFLRFYIQQGDTSAIRTILAASSDLPSDGFTVSLCILSIGRVFGEAAAFVGDYDQARKQYEVALVSCRRLPHRPEAAVTALQLAELLLDHYPEEHAAAIGHLDFAIAELRDMKMQPALERALGRRGLLKA